jgi:hypothetical protein
MSKAEIVSHFHDWTRTQDPEWYECERCGQKATIEDEEFLRRCPKS